MMSMRRRIFMRSIRNRYRVAQLRAGRLPRPALNLVLDWARLHQDELRINWQQAEEGKPLNDIDPLQ